jgi:predicted O-methyltransferase YrrM
MNLSTYYQYLQSGMDDDFEGHCQRCPAEAEMLKKLVMNDSIKSVLEIGFNAGHSSEIFLENNPNTHVVSFDLGEHDYGKKGKLYLDIKYSNRHTLILGDSRETVPKYHLDNPNKKFDLIFIDGGHMDGIPLADLRNCRKFAHSNTLLIFDDVKKTNIQHYNAEPTKIWYEYVDRNLITEYGQHDFSSTHGLAYGKYNLCELFICSLMTNQRQSIVAENQKLFPYAQIFPSVNGYDIESTVSELKKLNVQYHSLGFQTYGTLANWITKYKVLQHQVQNKIDYVCFIEDDVLLTPEFEDFMNDSIEYFRDPAVNIIRLNNWGEGYITSYSSAQRLLKILSETGIVLNIDDQLREKSGKELYLRNNYMKLQIGTNKGDCLKTEKIQTLQL